MSFFPVVPDSAISGTISALGGTVQLPFVGHNSASATLSGTWQGTLVFEISCDNALTWGRVWFTTITSETIFGGVPAPVYSVVSTGTNVNGIYRIFNTTGITHVRARALTWTSGSLSITLTVVAAVPNFMYTNGSVIQAVHDDPANSSSTNLDSGNSYAFTGTATSTLGVAGIQISLFANQRCTVYVDQAPDTSNWDITDRYQYEASSSFGITVQAIGAYYRVRVITASLTTTIFRLGSVLCPIIEAIPRSLDENGNFKVANPVDQYAFEVENTPTGEMRIVEPTRLVGVHFEGATIDPNFWNATNSGTGGATVTQANAQIVLSSGTNSTGYSRLNSVRKARYVSGNANRYRAVMQIPAGVAGNTRKWGIAWASNIPTAITDGAYFQIADTAFSVVVLKGGTPTTVSSGSFNGNYGPTYALATTVLTFEIYWTNSSVWFVVGDRVLHKFSASSSVWSNTMYHYIYMDNTNSGNTTDVTLTSRVASIYRLGPMLTQNTYKYMTSVSTSILKYGMGNLHSILITAATSGAVVTLYDGTSAGGSVISAFTLTWPVQSNFLPMSFDFKGLAFSDGLFVAITTQSATITVVYE